MQHPPFDKLHNIFSRYQEIQAVYLFGSSAAGRVRHESDLDLAVFPGTPELRLRKLDILQDLAREGFCNVDLVFLRENDIVLQYEAVRHNRLVYRRPDFEPGSLYSLTIRKYLDFLPYLEVQRKAYKKRILNGQT